MLNDGSPAFPTPPAKIASKQQCCVITAEEAPRHADALIAELEEDPS